MDKGIDVRREGNGEERKWDNKEDFMSDEGGLKPEGIVDEIGCDRKLYHSYCRVLETLHLCRTFVSSAVTFRTIIVQSLGEPHAATM